MNTTTTLASLSLMLMFGRKVFFLLMLVCVLGICQFSNAELMQVFYADPIYGSRRSMVNTETNNQWLALTYTKGISYNDVVNEMGPGQRFYGFRVATNDEVAEMFSDAGMPGGRWYGPREKIDEFITYGWGGIFSMTSTGAITVDETRVSGGKDIAF